MKAFEEPAAKPLDQPPVAQHSPTSQSQQSPNIYDSSLSSEAYMSNVKQMTEVKQANLELEKMNEREETIEHDKGFEELQVAVVTAAGHGKHSGAPILNYKRQDRAAEIRFPPSTRERFHKGLNFCVYLGNFPQVIRNALALRKDHNGQPLWHELEPKTDNILNMDLVWKPVNFFKREGYNEMTRRCQTKPEVPFSYCHFENIQILSTKPGLIRTLRDYYNRTEMFKKAGYTLQHTMAMSFLIPTGDNLQCEELKHLQKLIKKIEKKDLVGESLASKQIEKNFWICKPENENRGRGIEISNNYREIVNFLYTKQSKELFIVQKYIERPLLYKGRKFDIRVLALIDNERNLWLYKPCYLRTSSDAYTLDNQNKYVHLTNNCFQMHSENYSAHETGNQISYEDFEKYLDVQYASQDLDKSMIKQRIKDLMIDCHQAATNNLDPRKRPEYKFELIGYDFLLDEDFRVWLIEVNTCPFIGPVLIAEQPNFMLDLIHDVFKLTIDQVYSNKFLSRAEKESQTMFELLVSNDGIVNKRTKLEPINRRNDNWFPEYLYPSKKMHIELLQDNQKWVEKLAKQKLEEQVYMQKQIKIRELKHQQLFNLNQSAVNAYQNKVPGTSKQPAKGIKEKRTEMSQSGRFSKKRETQSSKLKHRSQDRVNEDEAVVKSSNNVEANTKSPNNGGEIRKSKTIEKRKQSKRPQQPFNLLEHVQNVLTVSQNKFSGQLVANQPSISEQPRKVFGKLFALIMLHLSHPETTMQAQGLQALVAVASSHFIIILQDESHLLKLIQLASPKAIVEEIKKEGDVTPKLKARAKIIECLTELCRTPAQSFFRAAILNSAAVYKKVIRSLLQALKQGSQDSILPYLNFMLALGLGPESGSKGFVYRTRRAIYIPGETQEQRRLKQKAIQSGFLVMVYYIKSKYPEYKEQVHEVFESLDNSDILLHFVILNHFVTSTLLNMEHSKQTEDPALRQSSDTNQSAFEGDTALKPDPAKQQQYLDDLRHFVETSLVNSNEVKIIRAQVDKLLNANIQKTERLTFFNHSYPRSVRQLFAAPANEDENQLFGISFFQDQLKWAMSAVEKRQKSLILNKQNLQPNPSQERKKEKVTAFQEMINQEILKQAEQTFHRQHSQSPKTVVPGLHNQNQYRGTLISQLKKNLIPKSTNVGPEKTKLTDENNNYIDTQLREVILNGSKPVNKSSSLNKFIVVDKRIPAPVDTSLKNFGQNHNDSYARQSLTKRDELLAISNPNVQSSKYKSVTPKSTFQREEDGDMPAQGSPQRREQMPVFIQTVIEPASYVFAPILSQPELAAAAKAQAEQPVLSLEKLENNNNTSSLPELKQNVNLGNINSSHKTAKDHKAESKKVKMSKLSQFQDQYEKLGQQARELAKSKKMSAKQQEDYKKALKHLGEMQISIERNTLQHQNSASLQPYLTSLVAPLTFITKDKMAPVPNDKGSNSKSKTSLLKVSSVDNLPAKSASKQELV